MMGISEEHTAELHKVAARDLQYFKRFPHRHFRARRPYPAEIAALDATTTGHKHFVSIVFRIAPAEDPKTVSTAAMVVPCGEPCPPDGLTDPEIDLLLRTIAMRAIGDATDASLFALLSMAVQHGTAIRLPDDPKG